MTIETTGRVLDAPAVRTGRDAAMPEFADREVARVLTGKPPLSPVNAAQLAIVHPGL